MTVTDFANRSEHTVRYPITIPDISCGADRDEQSLHDDENATERAIASLDLAQNVPRPKTGTRKSSLRKIDHRLVSSSRTIMLLSPMIAGVTSVALVATGFATQSQAMIFLVGSWSGHLFGFMSLFQQINAVDV